MAITLGQRVERRRYLFHTTAFYKEGIRACRQRFRLAIGVYREDDHLEST